jgi:CRP-like cAMP-binding protein
VSVEYFENIFDAIQHALDTLGINTTESNAFLTRCGRKPVPFFINAPLKTTAKKAGLMKLKRRYGMENEYLIDIMNAIEKRAKDQALYAVVTREEESGSCLVSKLW